MKRFIAIVLVVALVLSMSIFALTACDFLPGGNNGGDKTDNGGNNGDNETPSGNNGSTAGAAYDITFVWNNGDNPSTFRTKNNGFLSIDDIEYIMDEEKVARGGYEFQGWYADEEFTDKVDMADEFSSNATLYAKWSKTATYTTEGNGNEYVYFGEYPQTEINDEVLIEALKEIVGTPPSSITESTYDWKSMGCLVEGNVTDDCMYADVEYKGEKYRCVHIYKNRLSKGSSSYGNASAQYDNGYIAGKTYWFRFDPIKWYVYGKDASYDPKLVSTVVLDTIQFYSEVYEGTQDRDGATEVYANDYAHSDVRKMLIGEFYNTAFSETQKSLIKTTNVYNRLTDKNDVNYESSLHQTDTQDKVYLLSYNQVFRQQETGKYFMSTSSHCQIASSYAKCAGVNVGVDVAQWWLRTPWLNENETTGTYIVHTNGNFDHLAVDYTCAGILPALTMSWK